jgi:hypothetical protein
LFQRLAEIFPFFYIDIDEDDTVETVVNKIRDNVHLGKIMVWSPNTHRYFPKSIRDQVFFFLLFFKRNSNNKSYKLPKPVTYEIYNFLF